jgi:GH15 family glucan-1,4-alpha-glucosidase
VIGDARTAALVGRDGSIDWACFPRFNDPSIFGRLLDRAAGGYHRIVVPGGSREGYQRYVPSTNVLETCLIVDAARRLIITDFMPASASTDRSPPRILRQLKAEGGPIQVRVEVDPRFDYGRSPPLRWREDGTGAAVAASGRWLARFGAPWRWEFVGACARAEGTLRPRSPSAASVLWGDADAVRDVSALLEETTRFWRRWVHNPDAPMHRRAHVWHDWVERSELLLRLLTDTTTGAFVAAPTTSLPEWYGGPRNWDYRYVWIRDAAFAAQALLLLGHLAEGREYVRWVVSRLTGASEGQPGLRTLYDVEGGPPPPEEILGQWEGYERSQPVRIGNAAVEQLQLDIFGEVMDAVSLLLPIDPGFVEEHWSRLAELPELVARLWDRKDSGIWESRTAPAHFVHSKMMCWVALDRGAYLADRFGEGARARRWRRTGEAIRTAVLRRGYRPKLRSFVQAFDRPRPDASLLRLPMMGFLPFDHPKVVGTLRWVEARLADGPFVYRYEAPRTLHGPEGSFLACSFWLVECLARSGEKGRAVRNFRRLLHAAGPLKLFSEEYDPASGRRLGNYPQAFTHIGLLRAALAIGAEPAVGAWALPRPTGTKARFPPSKKHI